MLGPLSYTKNSLDKVLIGHRFQITSCYAVSEKIVAKPLYGVDTVCFMAYFQLVCSA